MLALVNGGEYLEITKQEDGTVLAETDNRDLAELMASNPFTKPLGVEDIHRILVEAMGWELVDVAAFINAANGFNLLNK